MPRLHLTDRAIRGLSTERIQEDVYDTVLPSFGVRVGQRDKAFFVRYRSKGHNRRVTLGRYPRLSLAEARERARAILGEVAQDTDPAAERARARNSQTFRALSEQYLVWAEANKRASSAKEDRRLLVHDLLPVLGALPVETIGRAEVQEVVDTVLRRGVRVGANRAFGLVRRIFNWALSRDLVSRNPCDRMERPVEERDRERVLSVSEIRTLWTEFDAQPQVLGIAFKILLLTAQRRGEVLGMWWKDVQDGLWTIRGHASKRKRDHVVPLSPLALELIERLRDDGSEVWVFPRQRRSNDGPASVDTLGHAAARIAARTGIEWRIHDLRRTASTLMAATGVPEKLIPRILGHQDGTVTAIYNRYAYVREMRAALNGWADLVQRIASGEEVVLASA